MIKSTQPIKKILIMAGGTGGHIFPGLAVASMLQEKQIDVQWLGTRTGLEAKLVTNTNLPIHYISIAGIRGKGIRQLFFAPFQLTRAIYQAVRILHKLKPDLIVGFGGFVSGPGGVASWLLRIPLVIHEQNAIAGFTNKCLALLSSKILQAFDHTFPQSAKVLTVGNPVRSDITKIPPPDERFANKQDFKLLMIGGSLGAAAINQVLPEALALIPEAMRPRILHQTGDKHLTETKSLYQKMQVIAEVVPFIDNMQQAYKEANLVICRAGASTIFELMAAGVGAILVPYPHAVDDHQTANAKYLVRRDAAILIPQAELQKEVLAELLAKLIANKAACLKMANAAYHLRQIDAASQVALICENLLTGKR